MKKLILISIFIILSTGSYAYSQKVEVEQSFLDDCTKAFTEVVALRDAVEKFKTERAKTDVERASADALIKGFNELIAIKDRTISQYALLSQFQQKIILFQQQVIDQLQSMLNKPKSAFQKFLKGVTEVLKAALFIVIGRGLAF